MSSYVMGFYPINPLDFQNHPGQKNRPINVHHFAFSVLALICSNSIITGDRIDQLWSMVQRIPTFNTIVKRIEQQKPINFQQLEDLSCSNDGVFFSSLDVASKLEKNSLCFSVGVYGVVDAKAIALNIMKSGLKSEIKKQQAEIIKKRKTSIN